MELKVEYSEKLNDPGQILLRSRGSGSNIQPFRTGLIKEKDRFECTLCTSKFPRQKIAEIRVEVVAAIANSKLEKLPTPAHMQ